MARIPLVLVEGKKILAMTPEEKSRLMQELARHAAAVGKLQDAGFEIVEGGLGTYTVRYVSRELREPKGL